MAVIKFRVNTTGERPTVATGDVVSLEFGDTLLFVADNQKHVCVDLGGQEDENRLIALVKQEGPPNFQVEKLADGRTIVKLLADIAISGPPLDDVP